MPYYNHVTICHHFSWFQSYFFLFRLDSTRQWPINCLPCCVQCLGIELWWTYLIRLLLLIRMYLLRQVPPSLETFKLEEDRPFGMDVSWEVRYPIGSIRCANISRIFFSSLPFLNIFHVLWSFIVNSTWHVFLFLGCWYMC